MSTTNEHDDQDDDETITAFPLLYIDGENVSLLDTGYEAGENLRVQLEHDDVANGYEVTGPLSWLNSAAIDFDYDQDSVSVSISVGDPRGAFVFTVRRRPDTGELLLHTPYPGEGMPHMALEALQPGTFRIGS